MNNSANTALEYKLTRIQSARRGDVLLGIEYRIEENRGCRVISIIRVEDVE